MILLICLILFIWGMVGLCSDYDHEAEVRNNIRRKERRHRETIKALQSRKSQKARKRRTRIIARDEKGHFLAQEVCEVDYE